MWVFGYGSLMWDDWEKCFRGKKYDRAKLRDYHRDFNKRSTASRGTRQQPCPTLGLVKQKGAECVGSAFLFEDKWKKTVLAYLRSREGSSFKLLKKPIELEDGCFIQAFTPVNDLKAATYIGDLSIEKKAQMARVAKGGEGNCLEYVRQIHKKLRSLDITDEHVSQMWNAIEGSPK